MKGMEQLKKDTLKEWIAKHDFFVVFCICLLLTISYSFYAPLASGDELWTFSNVAKLVNGGSLYIDNNVIQTPLFFWIGALFLKIFGTNFFVYRILNVVIFTILYFIVYQLFRTLKICKSRSLLYMLIVSIATRMNIPAGANYNMLAVLFCLMGMIFLLRGKDRKKDWALQGVFVFLVFLSKQNIGVIYAIALILSELLLHSKELKKMLSNMLLTASVAIGLCFLFLLGLYLGGNLSGFIDLAVLGIHEFANQNLMADFLQLVIATVFLIIIATFCIYLLQKHVKEQQKSRNGKILLGFAIPTIVIWYPIFNAYHIAMAYFFWIPMVMYLLDLVLEDILSQEKAKKTFDLLILILLVITLVHGGIYTTQFLQSDHKMQGLYYGVPIREETKENIQTVLEYVANRKQEMIDVKLVNEDALLYTNLTKEYHHLFDLPLVGNLGKAGEEGLIQQVHNLPFSTEVLIRTEPDRQESKQLQEFLQQNWEEKGVLEQFTIYIKR